jgi:hypothetical protein
VKLSPVKVKRARRSSELRTLLFKTRSVGELLVLEKRDYQTALGELYLAVAQGEQGAIARAMKKVALLNDFFMETGSTPTPYAHPVYRKLIHEGAEQLQAAYQKQWKIDDVIIQRALGCRHCGLQIIVTLPGEVDAVACPQCSAKISW